MKIGLIGDLILDRYCYGKVERISPESPTPIFSLQHEILRPGGAGNVAANLKALGATVDFYHSVDSCVKTRFVCDNHILFRVDNDQQASVWFDGAIMDQDAEYVIISDYNKGVVRDPLKIIENLKAFNKTVIVDPKKSLDNYVGADIIKLNEKEYASYVGQIDYTEAAKKYVTHALVITRASKSVLIVTHDSITEIPTEDHQVSDVTGAGDVFIAVMTFFLAKGDSLENAVRKATKLASISVTKFGTYTLTKTDIESADVKIIFTNGCFDIIHRGHIEYLKKSRELGDKLIVGLNSDDSIRRLKGLARPLTKQEDRKAILESLSFVDEVIIFEEDTPYDLIKKIKPDIITKGGDYEIEHVVGSDLAEVVIIPYVDGYSTTEIAENMNEGYC
jgi:D-beta-D-heptose 7-phosphate kinase/D-beta-D-heptose 1-phosphate adenosyltransferase